MPPLLLQLSPAAQLRWLFTRDWRTRIVKAATADRPVSGQPKRVHQRRCFKSPGPSGLFDSDCATDQAMPEQALAAPPHKVIVRSGDRAISINFPVQFLNQIAAIFACKRLIATGERHDLLFCSSIVGHLPTETREKTTWRHIVRCLDEAAHGVGNSPVDVYAALQIVMSMEGAECRVK